LEGPPGPGLGPHMEGERMNFAEAIKLFLTGVITIGVITALFAPGRQTVAGINAGFKGATGLLTAAEGR
jgi:hypothetical protein